jgi:PTH1 family peptidyl-tRNA hydrolase
MSFGAQCQCPHKCYNVSKIRESAIIIKKNDMITIIGLGNPGEQYKNTRHNVGFMAVDAFAKKNEFPDFKLQKKSNALTSEKNDVLLVKPQTFMNESGKSAKEILKNKNTGDLIVIHDDIDLPVGKMKIIKSRGSAGHKGVESIIKSVGNEGLIRFRIGIGGKNEAKAMNVVLKKFSKEEQELIDETIKKTADALNFFVKEGLDKTMNEYNR